MWCLRTCRKHAACIVKPCVSYKKTMAQPPETRSLWSRGEPEIHVQTAEEVCGAEVVVHQTQVPRWDELGILTFWGAIPEWS